MRSRGSTRTEIVAKTHSSLLNRLLSRRKLGGSQAETDKIF